MYVVKNPCSKFELNPWHHCSSTAFQDRLFYCIIFQLAVIFYFLRTPFGPCEWPVVCGLVYLVYLFFSYLSHALLDFSETGTTVVQEIFDSNNISWVLATHEN